RAHHAAARRPRGADARARHHRTRARAAAIARGRMKRLALVFLCSCTIAPKLVSVPMATSAPIAPLMAVPGDDGAPDDPASTRNDELSGAWNGRAWQSGKSWLMTLTFEKRGSDVLARSYYPDQRCRAEAVLRSTEPRQWA